MPELLTDDLNALLEVLPPHVRQPFANPADRENLIEIVMDLGRTPEARFPDREIILSERDITQEDIDYVSSRIGDFGDDNRAGIERTLHRISAIRNRKGKIVGLTLRVGRAVFGTIKIIQDLIQSGQSVLMLGRPGVGKTTMLREVARVLAGDLKKRVVIVDTSNEIAGDGDIPHPAIGHARRMQVRTPDMQHAVMIEAVENHMPQVIVIDEIGTELEALAARTIAERGVQLVGTAHGNVLDNLMLNPTLSDLIGGIQSVTLGDEEARRRGTQKTILERRAPPTFQVIVEIQERNKVAVHPDVGAAVDSILRGVSPSSEIRYLDENGEVVISKQQPSEEKVKVAAESLPLPKGKELPVMYLFGVNRSRMEEIAREMHLDIKLAERPEQAQLMVTSRNYYRRKPQRVRDAENMNIPIYVLKSHTPGQFHQLLATLSGRDVAFTADKPPEIDLAIHEAEEAIAQVKSSHIPVELSPQGAYIRRFQHIIAEKEHLSSHSLGKEPHRRVRISRG